MSVTAVLADERFDVTTLRETPAPGEKPAVTTYTCPRCRKRTRFRVRHFVGGRRLQFVPAVNEAFDDWAAGAGFLDTSFVSWRCRSCGLYVRAYVLRGRDAQGAPATAIAAVVEGSFSEEERLYSRWRALLIGAVAGGLLAFLFGGTLLTWLGLLPSARIGPGVIVPSGVVIGALLAWRFPKPVYWIGGTLLRGP